MNHFKVSCLHCKTQRGFDKLEEPFWSRVIGDKNFYGLLFVDRTPQDQAQSDKPVQGSILTSRTFPYHYVSRETILGFGTIKQNPIASSFLTRKFSFISQYRAKLFILYYYQAKAFPIPLKSVVESERIRSGTDGNSVGIRWIS